MKYMLIICLAALTHKLQAQLPEYYVYLVKGIVTKSNSKQPLKQGDFIFLKDTLTINKNAEITLVNKLQQYVELNTAQTLKVSALSGKLNGTYTGVTKKYLSLVWDEVLDPNYDVSKFKKKNMVDSYGGVFRGEDCNNLLFPINGLKTAEDSITFRWKKTSAANNYNFIIYDGAGKEIINNNATDTVIKISMQHQNLTANKYYWLIKSADATCEDEVPLYFQFMSNAEEQKAIATLGLQTSNDISTELQQIEKLEKNAFIYAAKQRYKTLVQQNEGNIAMQRMYVLFLFRYGFDDEAAAAWK